MPTGPKKKYDKPGDPSGLLRAVVAQALGDETAASSTIARALRGARRKELPTRRDAFLAFVERHLHGELRKKLGSDVSSALMDDLAVGLADCYPTKPPSGPAPARDDETIERPTIRAPDGETLPPVAVPKERAPARIQDDGRVSYVPGRRSVLVIDADRMARVDLSRALIRADCEVTVRDTCKGALSAADSYDVIVTDVDGVAVDELIEAFVDDPPSAAVIAWTVKRATSMFMAAGLTSFSVVHKEERPANVVAAVDALLSDRARPK
jgi:hypothetical protein